MSTDFPTKNPYQAISAGIFDVFITKLDASGDTLSYSTYLGGSSEDYAYGIAVDTSGNAYVTGRTDSTDFPTKNPYQAISAGFRDAFVTKLGPNGDTLSYSTYLGGSDIDRGVGIAVDTSGNAYVKGETASIDFPTLNPYQATLAGMIDGFVTKLDPSGDTLSYSTYLGGSSEDRASAIAVDTSGNAYVAGHTYSADFPTQNPYQAILGGPGACNAYVTKLDAGGDTLSYSTYLGGSIGERTDDLAVDTSGNAYVAGRTNSTDFPTQNPYQATPAGFGDAFVTKLGPSGDTLSYSTYLGGSDYDRAYAIAVDTSGNAYVAGSTNSTDFPTQNPYQAQLEGFSDAFVTKLGPSGDTISFSTYLGGNDGEDAYSISVDTDGNAYVTGVTQSIDFPTQNPYQDIYGGGLNDAFVTKLVLTTDSDSNSDDWCFVATAAFGSPMEPHVNVLREFRNRILLTNSVGKAFVDFYYTCSPAVANFIDNHDNVRAVAQWCLLPVVGMSWVALNIGVTPTLAFLLLIMILISAIPIVLVRKRRLGRQKA